MNINEIAKMAGVSRATVSRYLNNGYVSEEKKKVISKVIEETGYQPSSQAQMLRTKKTKLVGVILPKIDSNTILLPRPRKGAGGRGACVHVPGGKTGFLHPEGLSDDTGKYQ